MSARWTIPAGEWRLERLAADGAWLAISEPLSEAGNRDLVLPVRAGNHARYRLHCPADGTISAEVAVDLAAASPRDD